MALADITRGDVLKAIAEHQECGREEFLNRYGFSEARQYLVVYENAFFDSKPLLNAAHRYATGAPLIPAAFARSENLTARLLARLGFEVRSTRNPSWAWDELVLACDLVIKNGWRSLSATDKRVAELSDLLQRLPIHPPDERGEKFRNPNGVARKTADLATRRPGYEGKPTKGGALDVKVLNAFIHDPHRMEAAANLIRSGIESGALLDLPGAEGPDDEDVSAPEGRLLLRKHYVRERDRKLRDMRLKQARQLHGELSCQVCSFNFERTYGPRGADYIECHHVVPLHVSGETKTRLEDLALLCANCHRMIHRKSPWPTPDELRALIATQGVGASPA